MHLPARRVDYAAFVLVAVGVAGIVGHFWAQEYGGIGWSGITVGAGILIVGVCHVPRIAAAPIPVAVRAHIALAFVNIVPAAAMGVLLGFNKVHPFLPGYVQTNVYAHAHLAAIGWAALMVVGVACRLLPMFAADLRVVLDDGERPRATTRAPHDVPWRPGQHVVFGLWSIGVPLLATGLALDHVNAVRAGACALLAATLLDSLQAALILRHAHFSPRSASA